MALCALLAAAPLEAVGLRIGEPLRIDLPARSWKDLRDENVVRQQFDYSCAAAALATLLTFGMGDATSEVEVMESFLDGLDPAGEALRRNEGFSLLDMQRAAQKKGYRAEGFKIAPEALPQLGGPVIVFISPRGYDHFAVLRGVRGGRVYLADPSLGNVRRAGYDFLDTWVGEDGTGIIFVIEPEGSALPLTNRLALDEGELIRPELLSTEQLSRIGPGPRAGGRF